ncbi:hypothetical protein [Seonamhaeicola aphaedonensis]|uniref:Uncharacterized protein n=1 Tax=Seonamhaeicola aphaedonensis TaxID=1461338 RepID=A0A3D9HDT0_9FLAO|nr:hypothetical protein [Seonamhaeicola aphaedonensis]RED47630.1 hypothetical protein DFQ02_106259 [Seonamhaeicola aphaedonensis]
MTDNQIQNWIKILSQSNSEYFLLKKKLSLDSDLEEQAKVLSENLDIDYLEKELGLVVRFLSKNKNANIIKLSIKGNEVVNVGGWVKYNEKEKSKKRSQKIKEELKYWAGIVIPFCMLLIAFWKFKTETKDMKNNIVQELQDTQKIEQQELKSNIQILSKRVDSVSLTIEQMTDTLNKPNEKN